MVSERINNMKYAICYCYWNKNWEGTDYPKFIERARNCGFDGLEIFYGRTLTMPQSEVDEIKAACRANDVEIYISGGFGRDMDLSQPDEAGRKLAVKKAVELTHAMGKLGAHNFSGINYGAWCNFDAPENKEQLFEDAAKSLKEVGKAAADYDLSWNMEVVNRFESCMLNVASEAKKLAGMVDHPNINILLDIFHGMIEEDSLGDAIRIAGDKLGHYHMGSNNRKPPKPGFLPWQEVADALVEIGYNRCISFEPLVRTGGSVALEGGNVWRPMLPPDADDKMLDDMIMESLAFVKGLF
jgi:D-psicose/D-tagatose/L-ribulose 3-epimerase